MPTIAETRLQLTQQEYGKLKLADLKAIALVRYETYAYPLAYEIKTEWGIRGHIDRVKKPWLILLSQTIESNQPKIKRISEQRAMLREQFPLFYQNR